MTRFWRRGPVADRGTPPAKTAPKLPFDVAEAPTMLAEIIDHVEGGALLLIGTEVRWLNPAARLMFPDIEHPVGRPLVEVVRDHRIDGLALRARESGLEHAAEVELPRTDRILQIRAVPSQDGALILLARDVTRLRYLETVRQQFVANLSHEIRTPLAGLDLAAQTLSEQLPAEGDARTFIDRVIQESQRLQAILLNLTQLAALDADGIEVERAAFGVAALVADLGGRYQSRAAAAGLELRTEPVEDGLQALGDRGKTD